MKGSYLTRAVWNNTAALMVATVIILGSQALLSYLLARMLGPQDYGVMTLAYTILYLATAAMILGSDAYGMRWIATGTEAARQVPDLLLTFQALNALALVTGVAAVVVLSPLTAKERAFIGIMIVSLLPDAITVVVRTSLYGRESFVRFTTQTVVASVAVLVVAGAAVLRGASLLQVGVIIVALKLGTALAAWRLHRRLVGPLRPARPGPAYRSLLRPSFPYFLTTVLTALTMKANIPLIRIMQGTGAVGLFGLAATVANAAAIVCIQPLSVSLFPAVVREGGAGTVLDRGRALRTLCIPLAAGLLGGGLLCALAGPLIAAALGPAYAGSVAPLRILAWFLPPVFVSSTAIRMLTACGHTGTAVRILAVNLAVNLAANLVLIPGLGICGAAWSTVLSAVVSAAQTVQALLRLPHVPAAHPG